MTMSSVNLTLSSLSTTLNLTRGDNFTTTTLTPLVNEELGAVVERIFYVIYILAIVLGASGNIISIIVFTNGRRCNTDIRGFLINLAIADLMMAVVCLPFSFTSALLRRWIFSAPMCPIILFTQMLSVTVSVYTNTAISIDRFMAIKYPLKLLRTSRRHVHWVVAVIWVVSACLCGVQLWVGRLVRGADDTMQCEEVWPQSESGVDFRKWYTLIVLIITYIIPVFFIMTMYGLVCVKLWLRTTPGVLNQGRDARQLSIKQKVVKMLMTMSVLFTLCWLPLHLFFLIIDYKYVEWLSHLSNRYLTIIYLSVNWLAMSNSFQNPIIYGFLNDNFRADLAEMLLRCCPRLSHIKMLQRAALTNQPLSRLSTRMTLMTERGDSRADMLKHHRKNSQSESHLNSLKENRTATPPQKLLLSQKFSADKPLLSQGGRDRCRPSDASDTDSHVKHCCKADEVTNVTYEEHIDPLLSKMREDDS